jgi:hypothetical protein
MSFANERVQIAHHGFHPLVELTRHGYDVIFSAPAPALALAKLSN